MKFTAKETATVLAALRYWQKDLPQNETKANNRTGPLIDFHFEEVPPLTALQIDRLCERINCKPEPSNRVFLNVEGGVVQAVIADRRDLRVFIADYDFEGEDPDRLRSILPVEFSKADAYGKKNVDAAVRDFTNNVEQTIEEVDAL